MNNFFYTLRRIAKKQSTLVGKLLNLTLLDKEQTKALLKESRVLYNAGESTTLIRVINPATKEEPVFREESISTGSAYVWRRENADGKTTQLGNGSLLIGKKVLNTDFGNSVVIKDLFINRSRSQLTASTLIAPWSHYWAGYYDFVVFIALKICRIKDSLTAEEVANTVVSYPLNYRNFECEILELLGFKSASIVDSRKYKIRFHSCLVGNNDSWYYPNRQDVFGFKRMIESTISFEKAQNNKIYISRTGRRKIINEKALLILLRKFNFEVINDDSKSVAEQFAIYHHASFILGPHGASFINILCCRPGTHLFELFANTYVPNYFRYLAQVLNLDYSAYCHGSPKGDSHAHVGDDIYVDIPELERCLRALL